MATKPITLTVQEIDALTELLEKEQRTVNSLVNTTTDALYLHALDVLYSKLGEGYNLDENGEERE